MLLNYALLLCIFLLLLLCGYTSAQAPRSPINLRLGKGLATPQANYIVKNDTELAQAISSASGGNIIEVVGGSYGNLSISKSNTSEVIIRSAQGTSPVFNNITISGNYWTLDGLDVAPGTNTTAVNITGSNNTFRNSNITFGDSTNWSATDWLNNAGNGIFVRGSNTRLEFNYLKNVAFGISFYYNAANSTALGNTVDGFRGDGIRVLSDFTLIENNLIKNCYKVDGNHDDAIQSWSFANGQVGAGVVEGVVIRGNTIIQNDNPNQPLKGSLQGIGLFDGTFRNWLVEDNVIIVDHWHGISFYGSEGVTIRHNTVIDQDNTSSPRPWIKINNHKNGTPSTGAVVENNIAFSYSHSTESEVTSSGNVTIGFDDYDSYFVDFSAFNLKLKSSAPVAGVGARR